VQTQSISFAQTGLLFNKRSKITELLVILGTHAGEPVQEAASVSGRESEEPSYGGNGDVVPGEHLLRRVGLGKKFGEIILHGTGHFRFKRL